MQKRIISIVLAIVITLIPMTSFAETHDIAIASDRHGNETAIKTAMSGMPTDVEYVSLIGDMIGSGGGDQKAPEYKSSTIFDEINDVFNDLRFATQMSIIWADHDANCWDDAGILFGNNGYGSGLVKTGYNSDRSVAYYIYGIAFYEMKDASFAEVASDEFKDWVDTIEDNTIPIFIFCHMPMHYARGDNDGARYWSDAINYAAMGCDISEAKGNPVRNVVYCYGHNHTTESGQGYSGEFYVPAGTSMEVGPEEDDWTNIYYTYVTDGYLNQNLAATLLSIDDDDITITKYQNGVVADSDFYDKSSKKSGKFALNFIKDPVNMIDRVDKKTHIKDTVISGIEDKYTYTGSKIEPEISVTDEDNTVKYNVTFKNNLNAGEATAHIKGKGDYYGTIDKTFMITKASNTMKVVANRKKIKKAKVTKNKVAVKPIKVKNAVGSISYKKVSGSKKLTLNKKTGKITVKKGTGKGTYKIKVKVTAAGNRNYNKGVKTVNIRVAVVA